ncbi:MAG: hypothetical protein AAF548_03510 [Actinomycetota bacterium]
MRTRTLRLLAALFAFALLAAACGDDDSTADVAAPDAAESDDMADTDDGAMTDMDDDMDMSDEDHDHDDTHDHDADHDSDEHDGDEHDHDGEHDHGDPVEFEGAVAPTVAIDVESDPAGGINVVVTSTDFTVNAGAASTEHVEGEGHYHLWIDGEKVQRFYNDAIHYAGVAEGDVEVAVELSANDHRPYAVGGELVIATETFTVPPHSHDDHDHGDPTPVAWEGDAASLILTVEEDPKSGWNAFVDVAGLTLSPENVNGDHVAGEGHLHIYANGQKLGRLYGDATHIAVLPDGDVEISVVAYTNDHMPYEVDGQPISAAVTVTVAS